MDHPSTKGLTEIEINERDKKFRAFEDPDYKHKCDVCGQVPTVRYRLPNGKIYYHAGLCGVCTWGEADALDPANW